MFGGGVGEKFIQTGAGAAGSASTVVPSSNVSGLTSRQVLFGSSDGHIAQVSYFIFDSTVGGLGISVTNPIAPFDAFSGTSLSARFQRNATTDFSTILLLDNGALGVGARPGLAFGSVDTAGTTMALGGIAMQHSSNAPAKGRSEMEFYTRSSAGTLGQRAVINSSGQFGIGTTAPSQKLQVAGKVLVTTGSTVAVSYGAGEAKHGFNAATTNTLQLVNAGTEVVFVNTSGQVGVGTTVPAGVLHVGAGTTLVPNLKLSSGFVEQNAGATPAVSGAAAGRFYFDAGTSKFMASEGGGAYVNMIGGSGTTVSPGVGSTGFSSRALVFATSLGQLTNNSSAPQWDSTQNRLGIGTTAPGAALDVSTASFIRALNFNWPQYIEGTTQHYLLPGNDLSTVGSQGNWVGVISYIPVFLVRQLTLDRLALEVTSSGAGNARMAVYNVDTAWQPTTLVIDGGNVNTGTTGVKEATIAVTLPPGPYIFAHMTDNAGAFFRTSTVSMVGGGILNTIGSNPGIFGMGCTRAAATTVFANPGTTWTFIAAKSQGGCPLVVCRVSALG